MRIALLTLALLLPAASAAEMPPPKARGSASQAVPTRVCRDAFAVQPAKQPQRAKPQRLGELPPADLYLGVVNQVDGCIEPLKIREGFGTAR